MTDRKNLVAYNRARIQRFRDSKPTTPAMAVMDFELEALLDEIERLQAVIAGDPAPLRALMEKRGNATVTTIEAHGNAVMQLAAEFRWILKEAPHFVELKLKDDLGDMMITVQKVDGQTPSGKLQEWQEAADELDGRLGLPNDPRAVAEACRAYVEMEALLHHHGDDGPLVNAVETELAGLQSQIDDLIGQKTEATLAFGTEVEALRKEVERLKAHCEHQDGRVAVYEEALGRLVDPITGDAFFGVDSMDSADGPMWFATFGGPRDSYTMTEVADGAVEGTRERCDHDVDGWVGHESIGTVYVGDAAECMEQLLECARDLQNDPFVEVTVSRATDVVDEAALKEAQEHVDAFVRALVDAAKLRRRV